MIYKVLILLMSAGVVAASVEWKKWSGAMLLRNIVLMVLLILSILFGCIDYKHEEKNSSALNGKIDSIANTNNVIVKQAKHQDSIAIKTCENTAAILSHKNDSLKGIIGYYQSQKGNNNVQKRKC